MTKTILSAKWVLPITDQALKNAGVVVEDDKIVELGSTEELAKKYPDAVLEDFGRAIILPGFVDLHTHLEFSAMRGLCEDLAYTGWKLQLTEKIKPLVFDDWLVSARLGAIEAAQSGITTITDMTSTGASLKAAKEIGLRGFMLYELSGMNPNLIKSVVDKAKQTVSNWQEETDGSLLQIGVAPHSTYSVNPRLFKEVGDWARKDKLKISIHLSGSKDEYDFVKYGSSRLAGAYRDLMGWSDHLWQPTGTSPVRYLLQWGLFDNDVLGVHCVYVDDDDMSALKDNDVAVAHCPRCSAKLAMGIAPLRKYLNLGLRVGLGTDSPASNNTMDFFDEMRIGLLLQRAANHSVTENESESFIKLATYGGAQALGMEKDIGSLVPGKQADITVVDMSHSHQRPLTDPYSALVHTANQEDIMLTMVAGKIIYSDQTTIGPDTEETLQKIESVRAKLR